MVNTFNYTAQKAIDQFLHATRLKKLALDPLDVLNMAGDHFVNVRPWRFLKGANAFLKARGNISITNGTWIESTRFLTSAAAFANYTFIDGDTFKVTGGTSVIKKEIGLTSKASGDADNSIVLASSLASTAGDLATGDIAGTLHAPTLELPDDCGHIDSITGTTSLVVSVGMVDSLVINQLRGQWDREDDTGFYRAAMIFVGTPPRPVLDVHPDFGSNAEDVFRIFYLKSWTRITQASQTLPIPRFCNGAFMQLCRHFALGWEDEEEGGLEERLLIWEQGPVFKGAAKQDGRIQKAWGHISGGAIRRTPNFTFPSALSSQVADPT